MSTTWHVSFPMHPVDEEEKHLTTHCTGTHWESHLGIQDDLVVGGSLLLELLTSDLYDCILLRLADRANKDLILDSDHLMKGELKLANKIMFRPSL